MTATRTAGLVAGALVALVAALASYTHMRELAADHGETWLSWLVPLSVDGLIIVASLVILTARRTEEEAPVLAWLALVAGIAASLAANVVNAEDDPVARVVAAWPPAALAVCFELVLRLVRTTGDEAGNFLGSQEIAGHGPEPGDCQAENFTGSREVSEAEKGPVSVRTPREGVTEGSAPVDHQAEPGSSAGDRWAEHNGSPAARWAEPNTPPGEAGKGTHDPGTPGDATDLVDRARRLLAEHGHLGRGRLARELGVTEHQARRILAELDGPPVRLVS